LPNNTPKHRIGYDLTILPVVDSSNNYATQQIYDGKAVHGNAYLALEQTSGKGQRGRQWHTGNGQNLALSTVLEPTFLGLHQQFALHTYVCTSILQYLNTIKVGFTIKWPNDIYFNDRKAAGILIENIVQRNSWKNAVVGIGLNVNDKAIDMQNANAISLIQITGVFYDLLEIANGILQQLESNWNFFMEDVNPFFENYIANLYKKGTTIKLKQGNRVVSVVLKTVTMQGLLVCGENEEMEFKHGEVEWLVS
jgi:BirA family biotin operon repressor/biotin-[acetyl-CoA-carboxylase] ligase